MFQTTNQLFASGCGTHTGPWSQSIVRPVSQDLSESLRWLLSTHKKHVPRKTPLEEKWSRHVKTISLEMLGDY